MSRPPIALAYLLTLLAGLMAAHLTVLVARDQGCREYERVLLGRLMRTAPGSPQAKALRDEIQNFYDGRYGDCSRITADFNDTSDKFLAIILSLLTGAGVAAATAAPNSTTERPLDRRDERRESDRDVDG